MFGSCSPSSTCSFVLGSIERVLDNRLFNKLTNFLHILLFFYSIINNISSISVNMFWYSHLRPAVVLLCCNLCAGKEIIVELFLHLFFCFFLALPENLVFPRASTALITAPKRTLLSLLVCSIYEAASTDAPSTRIWAFLNPQFFFFSDRLEYSR